MYVLARSMSAPSARGDYAGPLGRGPRGRRSERDGGHDRLPGDRAQPVLERRRAPCRPRNHSTVTPAARRSNDGPKRRTAGPIPAGTECRTPHPLRAGDK